MTNDDALKPDQHYGPLEIWAGEWDQVGHAEWMGVAYTCNLPGRERYIRADRASVLDEGLVLTLRSYANNPNWREDGMVSVERTFLRRLLAALEHPHD